MPTPEQEDDKLVPSRHSFRKDRLDAALNIPTFAGGQTTLNGKDAPIPLHMLQAGRSTEDNMPSVNASIWDSVIMKEYFEKLGGEQGVQDKFNELHTIKTEVPAEDADADLDEPLMLTMTAPAPKVEVQQDQTEIVAEPEDALAVLNRLTAAAMRTQSRVPMTNDLLSVDDTAPIPTFTPTAPLRQRLVRASVDAAEAKCVDPSCGASLRDGAKFCGECGRPQVQVNKHCVECGVKFIAAEKFCSMCGTAR